MGRWADPDSASLDDLAEERAFDLMLELSGPLIMAERESTPARAAAARRVRDAMSANYLAGMTEVEQLEAIKPVLAEEGFLDRMEREWARRDPTPKQLERWRPMVRRRRDDTSTTRRRT